MTLTLTSAAGKTLLQSTNVAPALTPHAAALLQASMLDAWFYAKTEAERRAENGD